MLSDIEDFQYDGGSLIAKLVDGAPTLAQSKATRLVR